jgi:hypothetical protein
LGDWFAARAEPVRLLALSRRFDMREAITGVTREQRALQELARLADPLLLAVDGRLRGEPDADPAAVLRGLSAAETGLLLDLFADAPALQRALAEAASATPDEDEQAAVWELAADALASLLWRLPWMKEQVRFYEALGQRHLRSATYLLLTWEPPEVSGAAIAATLRHAIGREVQPLEQLPSPLESGYLEEATRLRPEQPGAPWLAVLLSYDLRGTWDATTLHPLLDVAFDVALAIDIQTLGRNRAMRSAELAFSTARMLARDQQVIDVRAQRVLADAELVMHQLTHQNLHLVQIAALVGGATAEELEANVAEVQGRLGTQLRLMRPSGMQAELLKLWSVTPTSQIDAPFKRRTVLSHGVGCCAGIVGYHRASATGGLFWGMDAVRRAPLFFDLFAGNQAAHMVILGKTGFGKTYFLNLLTLRGAAIAGYRVIGIDAFRNGDRVEAAAGGRGALLPHRHGEQRQHPRRGLRRRYAGRLGAQPGTARDRPARPAARHAGQGSQRSRPARAAPTLHRRAWPARPGAERPLRRCRSGRPARSHAHPERPDRPAAALRRAGGPGAGPRPCACCSSAAAPDGATTPTSLGASFNATTTVDWNFGRDINYYDFSSVPELLRPFYYAQTIGAINRYMRDPKRDTRHRTLLLIDEFAYVTQIEALARLAAEICKVARKYGIGLVAIDQNPGTFLDGENGRFIFENAVGKVLFHLDDLPARQMGAAISDLTPAHVEFLSHAGVGEALAVVGNDVYVMTVESNPKELRALRGS